MKKGSFSLSKEMVVWGPKFMVLSLVCVIIVVIVGINIDKNLQYYQLQDELVKQKLMSNSCFGSTLDVSRLTDNILQNCLNDYKSSVRVGLYDSINVLIKEVSYNPYNLLTSMHFCEKGDFYCYNRTDYISYLDNNVQQKGFLKIEMIGVK